MEKPTLTLKKNWALTKNKKQKTKNWSNLLDAFWPQFFFVFFFEIT